MTRVYETDPLKDPRWEALLRRDSRASIFHTAGWLEALRRTYDYKPLVLTLSAPNDDLTNGIVFCHVRSWLTGHRLVSLPFSDHCELLGGSTDDVSVLIAELQRYAMQENCRYTELRPVSVISHNQCHQPSATYYFHRLDLRPGIEPVFHGFHRDCVQRKIRRAEREALTIVAGRTPELLKQFYSLAVRTRRRHGLPPQPFVWFENLANCLGTALTVRIARKDGQPIAGVVTTEYKQSLVYKYGASDERFHNCGGMVYLFWIAIQDAINRGLLELDMGRSDTDNLGLIAFKDHWGASCFPLTYWRIQGTSPKALHTFAPGFIKKACSRIPDRYLGAFGALLYRHVG